ncbi:hypothetical protein JCM14635_19320 [Megalodesulfovibrio paquesii]
MVAPMPRVETQTSVRCCMRLATAAEKNSETLYPKENTSSIRAAWAWLKPISASMTGNSGGKITRAPKFKKNIPATASSQGRLERSEGLGGGAVSWCGMQDSVTGSPAGPDEKGPSGAQVLQKYRGNAR